MATRRKELRQEPHPRLSQISMSQRTTLRRTVTCSGVRPSFSARSMIGVPWVSSAQTYQHSLPDIFWKRTQMSVWMYSTRWPRWMAPLA